ncbi:MAG: hypothetical protein WCX83_00890 [Candidatus Cloacimonas sp.]|jgi:hypothetical protein|nr:hypothetical protein [Candidatus Cloacimonadota bacterium]
MNNITTVVASANREELLPFVEQLDANYNDRIIFVTEYEDVKENLEGKEPEIVVYILSDKPSDDEKDAMVSFIEKIKLEYPLCFVLVVGARKSSIKDKGFQDMVAAFITKGADKMLEEYDLLRPQVVRVKNKMISVLTGFFAPYLTGEYELGGFDQLLSGTYTREENLEILDSLKERFRLFASLLQEENRLLLENALEVYEERDLTDEERDIIRQEFFFQFNSLPAMENFSDRRQYYAEKKVISDVWKSTIAFSKEVEDAVIFGCRKLADVVQLRVTNLVEYDLDKISPRTKFYKMLQDLEPYGTVKVSCQDQVLYIGENHNIFDESSSEGLTFQFFFRVMVPERRRRGLKRF